jgi:uncharacterized membrane protein
VSDQPPHTKSETAQPPPDGAEQLLTYLPKSKIEVSDQSDAQNPIGEDDPKVASKFRALIRQEISLTSHSGPLPPPILLKEYEDALPGAAERIFAMAERQAAHRQDLEATSVKSGKNRSYAGIVAGFLVSVACVIGGLIVVNNGHDWAGVSIATVSVASLAGVFVYGTISSRKERENKAEMMGDLDKRNSVQPNLPIKNDPPSKKDADPKSEPMDRE